MIYFNSKYLAEKLKINLAKWKRWSREFLPPDPLGGLRSGYARQFNYRDAFIVYLGGRLVSRLNFSIPQAIQILADLNPWLKNQGYLALPAQADRTRRQSTQIRIIRLADASLGYEIRTYAEDGMASSGGVCAERYRQELIHMRPKHNRLHMADHGWVVYIDNLYQTFLSRLDG